MSRKGRPVGAATTSVVNHVDTSTCPACGSSARTGYNGCSRVDTGGELPDGRTYIAVWFRPCKCLECGQNRVDKSYDFSSKSDTRINDAAKH